MFNRIKFNIFVIFGAVVLASCTSGPQVIDQDAQEVLPKTPTASQTTYTAEPPAHLLEVVDPNSDKIYVFTDPTSYQEYLNNGEPPSGKEVNDFGQTRVFVNVPEDISVESIGSYQLYRGQIEPQNDFYAQRLVNGPKPRYYVFSNSELLNTSEGELPMQKTSLDGPNGELVIYSLQGADFYSLQQKFMAINSQ